MAVSIKFQFHRFAFWSSDQCAGIRPERRIASALRPKKKPPGLPEAALVLMDLISVYLAVRCCMGSNGSAAPAILKIGSYRLKLFE
jgi:hypothetical protein